MAIADDMRMQVAAVVDSGAPLLALLGEHGDDIDVVVCDYAMPVHDSEDGMALIHVLRERYPHVSLVVLTSIEDTAVLRDMVRAGVICIVSKRDGPRHLRTAATAAKDGRGYLSPVMKTALELYDPPARLSRGEAQVLELWASGMSIKAIATHLGKATSTISTQKAVALTKLGLGGRADLARYAWESRATHDDSAPP